MASIEDDKCPDSATEDAVEHLTALSNARADRHQRALLDVAREVAELRSLIFTARSAADHLREKKQEAPSRSKTRFDMARAGRPRGELEKLVPAPKPSRKK